LKIVFKGRTAQELIKKVRSEEFAKDKDWIKRVRSSNI
jgi:hypothetical protein